ncbi:uncharacterized protein PRCAT00003709001 [Priceomyces carsonii]|uniref:uncharacterized protein n=1 Tax=Priceomyces carsonii TaxID=28549 RepID=UPI002EDA8268|nr:unnamed protein product [Priceomyces carsonii]
MSKFDLGKSSSSGVKVELDRSQTGGTFTNYDVIRGEVKLTVPSAISLNYIQVKLEGISKTELNILRAQRGQRDDHRRRRKDRRDGDKKYRLVQDAHKVLYDTVLVFPPSNIKSLAKEFTLAPGNYVYPFEFKIPLNNSCVKMLGITNKILFSKNFDIVLNNGNFDATFFRNKAQLYLQNNLGNDDIKQQPMPQQYHITSQLPPSLSGMNDFASIKYFVKVTCKRSSFLKANLRAYDPFVFLPLDLDSHNLPLLQSNDYEEYKELFLRKDAIFRDRIPEIVGVKIPNEKPQKAPALTRVIPKKQGFLHKFFDSTATTIPPPPPTPPKDYSNKKASYPEIRSRDVPFSFEARFRHPAFLIPTKPPSFKLYLLTDLRPSRYTLAEYGKPDESNGLGVVYLQRLIVDLTSTTIISVLETDGSSNEIHTGTHEELINICDNMYPNLRFDLKDCRRGTSSSAFSSKGALPLNKYEIEIPPEYFENCILTDHLSPTFKTCNITRKYKLSITAGFSCEKVTDMTNPQEEKKIKYVDLQYPNIKVLSGLSMTSALHSNASGSSLSMAKPPLTSNNISSLSVNTNEKASLSKFPPPDISVASANCSYHSPSSFDSNFELPSLNLPTYDDVMRETTYQDDREHLSARRRYQQHEQYSHNLE